jgi:hypothetical protein
MEGVPVENCLLAAKLIRAGDWPRRPVTEILPLPNSLTLFLSTDLQVILKLIL